MSDSKPKFRVADHLFIDCPGYSHHGLYAGDDRVIHFESTPARKFLGTLKGDEPAICEVSLAEFSGGKQIHVRDYDEDVFSPKETIERALSRLGEKGYLLHENNCEHFVVWCKTGESSSTQVDSAKRVVQTGATGIAVGSAILRSAKVLPVPYKFLAYGAGAAIAVGATTYKLIVEKKSNRARSVS